MLLSTKMTLSSKLAQKYKINRTVCAKFVSMSTRPKKITKCKKTNRKKAQSRTKINREKREKHKRLATHKPYIRKLHRNLK